MKYVLFIILALVAGMLFEPVSDYLRDRRKRAVLERRRKAWAAESDWLRKHWER